MSLSVILDSRLARVGQVPEKLTFVEPPPGMATLTEFNITALETLGLMFALRADADPNVRLFAVAPRPYFPEYSPTIADSVLAGLGLAAGDEPVLLAVVSPVTDGQTTANLLAPIVVNPRTGAAMQVVLESDEWPLRAPLGHERSAA